MNFTTTMVHDGRIIQQTILFISIHIPSYFGNQGK